MRADAIQRGTLLQGTPVVGTFVSGASGQSEAAKLLPGDAASPDQFGIGVSIDGDRTVVGASWDDDRGFNSASAYVFRYDDNGTPQDASDDSWIAEAKLLAADGEETDHFGRSVSVSGDRILVGAADKTDIPHQSAAKVPPGPRT